MIKSNLSLVRKQVKTFTDSIDANAKNARDEMANTLVQLAMEEIKGERPYTMKGKTKVYEKATSGEPPMNRTGNLRRSIRSERFNTGFANYSAIVGPTVLYARAVELGGQFAPPSWKDGQNFPYMKPAWDKFQTVAPSIIRKHLLGKG